jgi:ParB/RepB/Spo0J family partition protein
MAPKPKTTGPKAPSPKTTAAKAAEASRPAVKTPAKAKPKTAPIPVQPLDSSPAGLINTVLPINCLITWNLNPRQPSPSEADDQIIRDRADSIQALGLLSPLLVRDTGRPSIAEGYTLHEVIAGERRRRALMLLLAEDRLEQRMVPVRLVVWDDAQALLAAGAENLARDDMHAMDEAMLFDNLVKAGMQERDIAAKLGVGERTVYRRRRLCRLVPDAQTAFRAGKMTKAQAEALAGGEADRQISMLPDLINREVDPGYITRVMTSGYPQEKQALFSMKRYRDAGGRTDVVPGYDNTEKTVLLDLELFKTLQEEVIADRIGALSEKWPWVDRLDQTEYPFGRDGYSRNGGSIRFPGAGALVVVSPDLTNVNFYEDVLKPGHLERWENAVKDGGEEALEQAREAEDAGEVPEPPPLPGAADAVEDDRAPGDAARLMTQPQIEFVRAAQTEALREAISTHSTAGLAWTILMMMGAVTEISISYGQDAKASNGDEYLIAVFDRLRPVWPECPTREELETSMSHYHIWRERPGLAASCFVALIEQSDATLAGLLAEVAASRIACWHNSYNAARTPFVSPLNAAVARAVQAETELPEFWRPGKDFWKGYDLIGLKAVLTHADFDPAGLHGAKKGELLATLADVSTDHTAGIPELRFLTSNDQEDAVIAARAKVLDATSPAAAADPAPTADGTDEEKEAA